MVFWWVWGAVETWVERRGGRGLEGMGSLGWRGGRGGWVRRDCAWRWVPAADAGMTDGRGAMVEGRRGEGRGRSRVPGRRSRTSGRRWRKAGRRRWFDGRSMNGGRRRRGRSGGRKRARQTTGIGDRVARLTQIVYTLSTDGVKWVNVGSGRAVAGGGGAYVVAWRMFTGGPDWRLKAVRLSTDVIRSASSDRQNANPAAALVNHDQGAGRQVGLVLVESGDDRAFQVVREDVPGADLEHTRAYPMR